MILQAYSYRPADWQYNKMKWENTLFMGLELEMECNPTLYKNYICRDELRPVLLDKLEAVLTKLRRGNSFYAKRDGSLTDGIELVTHPFTLQYAHSKLKLNELTTYLHSKDSGFVTSPNTGIHVHLTKNFFTSFELRKMRAFFNINYNPYIEKFGQRKKTSSYGRLNDPLSYKQFITAEAEIIENIGRGNCIAIRNGLESTIEIRLFQSSTNPDRIRAILQFCDAISYFVKEMSLATILNKKTSWKNFIEWCTYQNRYQQFIKNWELIDNGKYKDIMFRVEN